MNLYFDNASTSFPKPQAVVDAITHFMTYVGGTYGRGAYARVVESTTIAEQCRDLLAQRLGSNNSSVNIFFTHNATAASNTLLKGMGLKNCKILVSPMEHNAVMRPLQHLVQNYGITVETLPHDKFGRVDCYQLTHMNLSDVALIVVNHQSNVSGVIQPLGEIKVAAPHTPVMVDLSQSLGAVPCHVDTWGVDYAIFTGHKSLFGPTGIGGFYARRPDTIATAMHGGTGSRSDTFLMPESYPDRFEAGTPNMVGIAGLCTALENVPASQHTFEDFRTLMEQTQQIDGITLHAAVEDTREATTSVQGELFSFTHSSIPPSVICQRLFERHGIETRQGLHCAPLAHRTLGTFPNGTLRIAPSPYHTSEDFALLVGAIKDVCER